VNASPPPGGLGTSWRQHANVSWLTNQGVMIMTCFLVVNALTQFRFVLVPLVMAYFLTVRARRGAVNRPSCSPP
jgi:hypothetical protein